MGHPDFIKGTLNEDSPTGTIQNLYGFQTYVVTPPSGTPLKATVVIIPDAFGWAFNNNRILADNYAKKGNFRVLLPDFMEDQALKPHVLPLMDKISEKHDNWGMHSLQKGVYVFQLMGKLIPFFTTCGFSATHPRIVIFMRGLRGENATHPVGAAGFCWGGKHVFMLASGTEKAANGKNLIDAAFAEHPSHLILPTDAEAVKVPMSVASPSGNNQVAKDKIPVLQAALLQCPAECEIRIYEGAGHGMELSCM